MFENTDVKSYIPADICFKCSVLGVHDDEKQNCPPENAVYGQNWLSDMINQVWTGWKLSHASPNHEEILLKMQGMHNLYTKYIHVYLGAYD